MKHQRNQVVIPITTHTCTQANVDLIWITIWNRFDWIGSKTFFFKEEIVFFLKTK